MTLMTLGGIPLNVNPNEARWNFKMKTAETRTMGGKVIQILGTTLGDLSLRGTFGRGDVSKGDTEGWQSQVRFMEQVRAWAQEPVNNSRVAPLRFTYSPRQWDFNVFVRAISPVAHRFNEINSQWEMALFPVDDGAMAVVSGIKDLYLSRLMDGVGWKQSTYNGPTQAEVDALLNPFAGSVPDYFRQQFSNVFTGGPGAPGAAAPSTGGAAGTGGVTVGPAASGPAVPGSAGTAPSAPKPG